MKAIHLAFHLSHRRRDFTVSRKASWVNTTSIEETCLLEIHRYHFHHGFSIYWRARHQTYNCTENHERQYYQIYLVSSFNNFNGRACKIDMNDKWQLISLPCSSFHLGRPVWRWGPPISQMNNRYWNAQVIARNKCRGEPYEIICRVIYLQPAPRSRHANNRVAGTGHLMGSHFLKKYYRDIQFHWSYDD